MLVTGEDPFADDIDAGGRTGFADPAAYDFSIVHYTDTQYLSEGAVEQETPQERAIWEKAYGDVTRWIAANADDRKIAYVAHTGDIIENNIRKPADEAMERQVVGEFEVSSRQQQVLDDAGVANGVIAGNHDNQSGTENGPGGDLQPYYGPDRYAAAAKRWTERVVRRSVAAPGDNQNHYDLFSAGGLDFVVVGLSYGVTRDEAEWADAIFKRYPDRNGILLSHDYLAAVDQPGRPRRDLLRARRLDALQHGRRGQPQRVPDPRRARARRRHQREARRSATSARRASSCSRTTSSTRSSADRLGLTEIGGYQPRRPAAVRRELLPAAAVRRRSRRDVVDTYSPLLDDFGATEYDTDRRYNGQEDNMVLPVDLTSRDDQLRDRLGRGLRRRPP